VKRPAALRQKADGQRGWLVNRREIVVSLYVIRSTIGDERRPRALADGRGRRDTSTGGKVQIVRGDNGVASGNASRQDGHELPPPAARALSRRH